MIGLVSDGGVHSSLGHLEALIELAASSGCPTWSCTRSPTAATRCRSRAPATWTQVERMDGRGRRRARSGRSSAATTRWIATGAGTGSRRPTTCSSTAAPSTRAQTGAEAARAAYERGETDEFITPIGGRRRGPDPPATTRCSGSTSVPTGCARSPARWPIPGLTEIDRGGAEPVRRYTTMTEYEEGWPYPVAFAPRATAGRRWRP